VGPLDVLYRHAVPEFQAPFNLAGVPALSVPCGFSADGLPLALQLAGKPFDEATVLRAGYAYQQATDWHRRHPPI
jgi:aspartyl-tRNA(Asn)/glutamyl-tRNA(Gln) amidotransferase subunit A